MKKFRELLEIRNVHVLTKVLPTIKFINVIFFYLLKLQKIIQKKELFFINSIFFIVSYIFDCLYDVTNKTIFLFFFEIIQRFKISIFILV